MLADDFDAEKVMKHCPPNFTGADFYGLCADANLTAVKRAIADLERSGADPKSASPPKVTEDDFITAMSEITPSVSEADIAHYTEVHRQFSSAVPASI